MSYDKLFSKHPELAEKLDDGDIRLLALKPELASKLLENDGLLKAVLIKPSLLKFLCQNPEESKDTSQEQYKQTQPVQLQRTDRRGRPASHKIEDYCSEDELSPLKTLAGKAWDEKSKQLQKLSKERAQRPRLLADAWAKQQNLRVGDALLTAQTTTGQAFLFKLPDDYVLFYADYREDNGIRRTLRYASKKEAEEVLKSLATVTDHVFKTVAEYRADADAIYAAPQLDILSVRRFRLTLGFVLAFFLAKERWSEPRVGNANEILAIIGNIPLPLFKKTKGVVVQNDAWVRSILEKLATRQRGEGAFVAEDTFRDRASFVRDAFYWSEKRLGKPEFSDYFHDCLQCGDAIQALTDSLVQELDLDDAGHYPPLSLRDVNAVLSYLSSISLNEYLYSCLHLATCLRNEEMKRLVAYQKSATNKNITELNYKAPLKDRNGLTVMYEGKPLYLSMKTLGKVDLDSVQNPPLTLPAELILTHFDLQPSDDRLWEKDSALRNSLREPEGHRRSLRTTAATMYRAGQITQVAKPIETKVIQRMMNHTTEQMISQIYARRLPDGFNDDPDEYFDLAPIIINGNDGKLIVDRQTFAWSLWLLRHLLSTLKAMLSPTEYRKIELWLGEKTVRNKSKQREPRPI